MLTIYMSSTPPTDTRTPKLFVEWKRGILVWLEETLLESNIRKDCAKGAIAILCTAPQDAQEYPQSYNEALTSVTSAYNAEKDIYKDIQKEFNRVENKMDHIPPPDISTPQQFQSWKEGLIMGTSDTIEQIWDVSDRIIDIQKEISEVVGLKELFPKHSEKLRNIFNDIIQTTAIEVKNKQKELSRIEDMDYGEYYA